jgi:hypothetical protein
MTGILDRIRATTPETLEGLRTDFDDAPRPVYRAKQPKGMIRTVEGADDLKVTRPAPVAPGMSKAQDWSDKPEIFTRDEDDHTAHMPKTGASERQVNLINLRLSWLAEVDPDGAAAMTSWLERGGWGTLTGGRGGSASNLIDRIKARHEEKKAARPAAAPVPSTNLGDFTWKTDKNGKPMHLRFAVEVEDGLKFYRIKPGRKPGFFFIDVQASDDLYPIRNSVSKARILEAIAAAGPEACMARYGQEIGDCGRCGTTLTDSVSRARGIGPDCWEKM